MIKSEERIHPSWMAVGGIALEIMKGLHDDEINNIQQACRARFKSMYRKGATCRLTGTRNVELDGKECVIIKVNTKSITVGVGKKDQFGYEKEYNVPQAMLEVLS